MSEADPKRARTPVFALYPKSSRTMSSKHRGILGAVRLEEGLDASHFTLTQLTMGKRRIESSGASVVGSDWVNPGLRNTMLRWELNSRYWLSYCLYRSCCGLPSRQSLSSLVPLILCENSRERWVGREEGKRDISFASAIF